MIDLPLFLDQDGMQIQTNRSKFQAERPCRARSSAFAPRLRISVPGRRGRHGQASLLGGTRPAILPSTRASPPVPCRSLPGGARADGFLFSYNRRRREKASGLRGGEPSHERRHALEIHVGQAVRTQAVGRAPRPARPLVAVQQGRQERNVLGRLVVVDGAAPRAPMWHR